MSRYKSDPEKYDLSDDSISCRGAWILRSFGRNAAGQIYVYLKDLGELPISEQRYWKSFNTEPEGNISTKSIRRDFLGDWDEDYDPLESIKLKVRELDGRKPSWWQPRHERLIKEVHYPLTDSGKELGDALLALHQLVVEGLSQSGLTSIAEDLKRPCDKAWKSLKLTTECLQGLGASADEAKEIMCPLLELNKLRAKLAAHSSTAERNRILANAQKESGSFHDYFKRIACKCDLSLSKVMEKLEGSTQ